MFENKESHNPVKEQHKSNNWEGGRTARYLEYIYHRTDWN